MSLGKNKSNYSSLAFARPDSVNTGNPGMNMQFVPQGNLFGGGLTDAQRKQLGLPAFNVKPFGALVSSTPIKYNPSKEETPKTATNIPKFSGFGNKLAQMGGFNKILGEKDLSAMTQEEVNKYEADRLQSRNRGTQDLLMALGSAFKGEDIASNVQNLRDRRTQADDLQKEEELNKKIAEAYASGDYDLVNQLMLEKGDGAGIQAISNKINKGRPEVSADGKFRLEYDDMGNVINMTPIQENIDALNRANSVFGSADANEVLKGTKQSRVLDEKESSIDRFLQNIEDGELEFGVIDGVFNALAESGIGVTDAEAINSREFKNFRNGLVTDLLNLQTGTKTDFDWQALSEELKGVNTTAGMKAWLEEYKQGLIEERQAIEDERDLYMELRGLDNPFNKKPTNFENIEAD